MCGYSLEAPRRSASNEYHNIFFRGVIRKKQISCGYNLSDGVDYETKMKVKT